MRKSFSVNLAAGAIGLIAATSYADVKVNDQLSLSGFLDMSLWGASSDAGGSTLNATFDQFELDLLFKFSESLTARADLSQGGVGGGAGALAVEQAFLTYTTGSLSLTTGKFLSATGFEAAEPTGMYQYSYNLGVGAYGGYITGAALSYTVSPMISLYGAVVATEWNALNDDPASDITSPGLEAQITLVPTEGLTAKVAVMYEEVSAPAAPNYDMTVINAWASYAKGPLLVAGELNTLMDYYADDANGFSGLAMVNFKVTDKAAVTGRYSAIGVSDDGMGVLSEVTLSPSYAFATNWFALAEVRYDLEPEVISYAVETTVTF